MRAAAGLVALLAVVLASCLGGAVADDREQRTENREQRTSLDLKKQRDDRILKLFVGYYSKTTSLTIQTRTKTAIFTCLSTTAGMVACRGRRRRSLIQDTDLEAEILDDVDPTELDGSQDPEAVDSPLADNGRQGRKLTLWTAVFSTLEVTTTIYNTGTTLTASALCNIVNGMTIGNSCFG